MSRCRFVGIDSANPELSHERLSTNITMSDPLTASTNALIANSPRNLRLAHRSFRSRADCPLLRAFSSVPKEQSGSLRAIEDLAQHRRRLARSSLSPQTLAPAITQ